MHLTVLAGDVPCLLYERTASGEVYFKEVAEHKPLVLNLYFSPEHNMTFTEHPVNPEVGFVNRQVLQVSLEEADSELSLFTQGDEEDS